jgi:hypothetical protein
MVQTNKTPAFNITNKLLHQYITHQISHSAAQHNSDVHIMSILSLSTNPKKKYYLSSKNYSTKQDKTKSTKTHFSTTTKKKKPH